MDINADIIKNLEVIHERIKAACERAGRDPQEVKLLMATKTVTPDKIKIAINAGNALIGENKVQEVKEKYEALLDTPHVSHFIGHLQTNKIKDLIKCGVTLIESVDSFHAAEKLQERLEFDDKEMDIFFQIKTSDEETKFGADPKEAVEIVRQISQLNRVHVKGLMTVGLFDAEMEKVRPCFKLLKKVQQEIVAANIPGIEMNELSMGMSGDFETAIEEGSTIVRIGSAIFGKRDHTYKYYWPEHRE